MKLAKTSQRTVLPRFNAERQVMEYTTRFYAPAARLARALGADDHAGARALAAWKARVAAAWPGLGLRLLDGPPATLPAGGSFELQVALALNGLAATDVHVECQLGALSADGMFQPQTCVALAPCAAQDGETRYAATVTPALSGLAALRLRAWPTHPLLAHRFELGRMRWL